MESPLYCGQVVLFRGSFFYFFPSAAGIRKRTGQIEPELFHSTQKMAWAGQDFFVSLIQLLVERTEGCCSVTAAEKVTPNGCRQEGVGKSATANHPALDGGKLLLQTTQSFGGGDVAVVDYGVVGQGLAACETCRVGRAPIQLFAQAGMDNDFFEGIPVKPRQEGCELIWALEPQAGFDRKLHGEFRNDLIQQGKDGVREWEQAGAAFFAGDHWRRASQVPVDMIVAQLMQTVGQGQQSLRVGVEELWNYREIMVMFRQEVTELSGIKIGMRLWVDKGGDGLIESSEMALEQAAEQVIGNATNGCQIEKGRAIHDQAWPS